MRVTRAVKSQGGALPPTDPIKRYDFPLGVYDLSAAKIPDNPSFDLYQFESFFRDERSSRVENHGASAETKPHRGWVPREDRQVHVINHKDVDGTLLDEALSLKVKLGAALSDEELATYK
jgi:hypothetical protein